MNEISDFAIKVKRSTAQKLRGIGSMGDSYDVVINLLLDNYEEKLKEDFTIQSDVFRPDYEKIKSLLDRYAGTGLKGYIKFENEVDSFEIAESLKVRLKLGMSVLNTKGVDKKDILNEIKDIKEWEKKHLKYEKEKDPDTGIVKTTVRVVYEEF